MLRPDVEMEDVTHDWCFSKFHQIQWGDHFLFEGYFHDFQNVHYMVKALVDFPMQFFGPVIPTYFKTTLRKIGSCCFVNIILLVKRVG